MAIKKTVYVAMSGGVDSSVAAALLKKQDYNVVGVFMKPPSYAEGFGGHSDLCNWQEDREYALRVAIELEVPLLTWDLSGEYEKKVTRYMIDGYKNGITPNPDVMCNKHIKFGVFLKRALKEGADYIATGHYARIREQIQNSKPKILNNFQNSKLENYKLKAISYQLLKARDLNKDQSYFLYTLTQKQLKYCLFPIGNYTKPEVRKLAKKIGLPNWNKKDSQGICFVGELEMEEFLKNYIPPKEGDIVRTSDKKVIGAHQGIWYYTIGQHHGLGIQGNGVTYFVVDKNMKKNIIYVDKLEEGSGLFKDSVKIKEVNWIDPKTRLPLKAGVKTRYRQPEQEVVIDKNLYLKFTKSQKTLTAGQSAVLYQKDVVIGGGIIV